MKSFWQRKIGRREFLRKLWISAGLASWFVSYPFFIERYIVQVNHYLIPVPNLPKAFSGYTIVQLADLHYGPLVPLGLIRLVIGMANRVQRNLTICTGDYVHERYGPEPVNQVWPVLSGLRAPDGVLSILGNRDHLGDTGRSLYWLAQTGQDLRHKVRPIVRGGSRIWFAGAGDRWEDHIGLDDLLKGVPEEECRIVLAHNPDTADTDFAARVDLFISGHTHGGQVNIPFIGTPILPVENKNYSSGLKRSKRGAAVFISRGIGWAVYPVRFNCFPEIAVLELTPA